MQIKVVHKIMQICLSDKAAKLFFLKFARKIQKVYNYSQAA